MNKEKLHGFRRKLRWIVFFGGLIADVIVSCGFLFLKSLFHMAFEICAGAFTLKLLGITLLKCCLAPIAWYAILWCVEVTAGYLGDY